MSIQILRDRIEWWIDANPGWKLSDEIAAGLRLNGHFDRNRLARVLDVMKEEGVVQRTRAKSKTWWAKSDV